MEFQNILYEVRGNYAVLTMNRPEERNALNHAILADMQAALDDLESRPDIRGLIITGAGKAFVAGADIKEIPVGDPEAERRGVIEAQNVTNRVAALEIPTIAAVNGYALGGGNELAMACDLCIASTAAVFGQPEVSLGVNICYGGSQRLTRLVGPRLAKELLFTGRRVKAQEAKEMGLVNKVVEPERLMEEAEAMMGKICEMAPIAVRCSKLLVDHGMEMSARQSWEMERDMAALCIATQDLREGVDAFLERRKPVFANR